MRYCESFSLYELGEWICSSKLLGCQLRVVVRFEAEGKLRSSYQKVLRGQSPSAICLAAAATTYHGSGNAGDVSFKWSANRCQCRRSQAHARLLALQRCRVMRGNAGHALLVKTSIQHLFTTDRTPKHVKDSIRIKEIQEASNRQCSHLKESCICVLLANQTQRTSGLAECSASGRS